jgi:type II secretory pathway component PulJ
VVNRVARWNGEAGFTLVEVLVAATMMFAVLFALYAVFDVSVRAFGYGGDKMDAVGNARLALDRMEREIRAAYPYDPTTDPPRRYLFLDPLDPTMPAVPTATRIAFGNETGGDRKISASEVVGYYLSGHDLRRSKGGSVQTLVDSVATDGLRFTPCRSAADCPPAVAVTDEAEVRLVRIELAVEVERRGEGPARQRLATDVYLRNRGGR